MQKNLKITIWEELAVKKLKKKTLLVGHWRHWRLNEQVSNKGRRITWMGFPILLYLVNLDLTRTIHFQDKAILNWMIFLIVTEKPSLGSVNKVCIVLCLLPSFVDPLWNKFLTRRSLFPQRSVTKRTVHHASLILGAHLVLKWLVNTFLNTKRLQEKSKQTEICILAKQHEPTNTTPTKTIQAFEPCFEFRDWCMWLILLWTNSVAINLQLSFKSGDWCFYRTKSIIEYLIWSNE